jgi:hypothetical protein
LSYKTNKLSIVLNYLDIVGPLLGLCIFFFKKGIKAEGCVFVAGYLLLQLLANGLAKYLMLAGAPTNIFVYQANALFSLILISYWFVAELKNIVARRVFIFLRWYTWAAILIMWPIILLEDASALNSLSLSFASFNICLYCIIFYVSSLTKLEEDNLLQSQSFWTVTAFFLYYSTCFFIYISYKIFTQNGNNYFQVLWSIHNFILYLGCILQKKT